MVPQVRQDRTCAPPLRASLAILDALAAIRDGSVMESSDLPRGGARESNCIPVGVCRRLAINRLGDAEHASLRATKMRPFGSAWPRWGANGTQHSVIEFLGRRHIVSADPYVNLAAEPSSQFFVPRPTPKCALT
jgi:hypothetical protein